MPLDQPAAIPVIPEHAPFSAEQRHWLNGFLAGLFSNQASPAPPIEQKPSRGRVVIMFGSQSGNAESLAETFSEQLKQSDFDAPVIDMEDHGEVDLSKETHLVVVTSTWGEGDPPDNAAEFWAQLNEDDQAPLEGLNFAVCGLGDSNYVDFCGMGKHFDARLEALGATRMIDRVDCDVDFEEPAEAWALGLLSHLGAGETSTPATAKEGATTAQYSKKNPFPAPLLKNVRLNSLDSARDTRHFEISLEGSGLEYEAGDALGVVPQNCPEVAAELISALGFSQDENVSTPSGESKSLIEAFTYDYAITIPSKKLVTAFAEKTSTEIDADYLYGREIIDLVTEFQDVKFSPTDFIGMLGKLQPRLYSISSSPKAHPGEVHLTIATVRYEAHGRERKGVCSTFLAERCNGDGAKVFVHPSKSFKPPTDLETKMIMVGPGTGIAPFRAFLEERRETGASGENWLFFGNPHRSSDFLYEDELTAMTEQGSLNRLDTAWSRDSDKKVYVQNLMSDNGEELWRWLDDGAHFYVCGDAKRMAKDVDQVLHDVVATHGGKGEEGAIEYISKMRKDRRYQRDVY